MLEIRLNCEYCEKNLPANSSEAYICSYECTFCRDCVEQVLHNVCPNCGGGFSTRPIRPQKAYRAGVSLEHQKASEQRITRKYSKEDIQSLVKKVRHIPPENR